jgi:hypothetical protein
VWRADYETGAESGGVRLGAGSGSTPSLMGTAHDDDRFVVITDGQDLMHLVLLWRGEIPAGWEPIAPGKDPRIACEIPVRFGDPDTARMLSEQSVLVRGYSAVVVNDKLTDETLHDDISGTARRAVLNALEGGDPDQAAVGLERFDWEPASRTCRSVWANSTVSLPNGILTMREPAARVGTRERSRLRWCSLWPTWWRCWSLPAGRPTQVSNAVRTRSKRRRNTAPAV